MGKKCRLCWTDDAVEHSEECWLVEETDTWHVQIPGHSIVLTGTELFTRGKVAFADDDGLFFLEPDQVVWIELI